MATIIQAAPDDGKPNPQIGSNVPTRPTDEKHAVFDTTNEVSTSMATPDLEVGLTPPAKVRISSSASATTRTRKELLFNLAPRRYHKWKSPLLMLVFYLCGLGTSIGHCAFYASLDKSIVGGPHQQGTNLRFGTAAAFLSQIAMSACVWQCYTGWLWRSVGKTAMSIPALNSMFGADTSLISFLSLEMLRKFKIGYFMALFAWSLILPPFFTPGTLFVYPSTNKLVTEQAVPSLTIANSTDGQYYSYSPSVDGDSYNLKNVTSRVFAGPRTVLTVLSTATASGGEILRIKAPYNHSSYSVSFLGPAVKCSKADPSVESKIDELLTQKMDKPLGTAKELINALYSFVPSFSDGEVTALSEVRYQEPLNASNEVWMVFMRYFESSNGQPCEYKPYHQVCKLWNATYDLDLSWENGLQTITGSRSLLHEVSYPNDQAGEVSNMAQHAYSAFMWVLADQVVGSFGWYNDTSTPNNKTFGIIDSPLQHNTLLGSSDLDVFFDFNEEAGACKLPYDQLSPQRRQDKDLARNRTLDVLIEELSFNVTVSLMHNELLTDNTTALVTYWAEINRYGYSATGLFIPYALAYLFTTITVMIGIFTFRRHGVHPDRKFQDILCASGDPETIQLAMHRDSRTSRRRSLTAKFDGDGRRPTFRVWGV